MDRLTFTINTQSLMPIYEQLYAFIKAEIQSGQIAHNTKLPSKRKLSGYLGISQNTIQSAYNQLIEEGYVYAKERSGYFVSKIDNLINLEAKELLPEAIPEANRPMIKYDFSYRGVDMDNFPFSTWRKLSKEAFNEYDEDLLRGGDSLGDIRLRKSIADYLHQSRGVNCTPDQIVISSGTESLFQILIQLFDRASSYGIENPGYEKLNKLFPSNGVNFKSIDIDDAGMMPDEIRKSDVNIVCLTPAHQFPSGQIMPINRKVQILNWANESSDRYIIEDDYDSEFKYSGKPMPALQGLDTNGKVIYMGSFSKALTPALRVSYMVLPPHLLRRYIQDLFYIVCPVPMVIQKMLCQFIEKGYFDRHLNKMRNIYKRKREILINSLEKMGDKIEIMGADAGLHLLLKVDNGMSEAQLVSLALQNGIRIYGISKYYHKPDKLGSTPIIVIGFATMNEQAIESAVAVLYKAWFKTKGNKGK